jgi:hypothetical protein
MISMAVHRAPVPVIDGTSIKIKSFGDVPMLLDKNFTHADSTKHNSDVPSRLRSIRLAVTTHLLCLLSIDIRHMRNLQQMAPHG